MKNNRINYTGAIALKFIAVLMVLGVMLSGCSKEETTTNKSEEETQAVSSSEDLYCVEFSSYSGPFVEDGSNEQVENVLAMLVENRSEDYLEYALVTYDVFGKTAEFVVTGLPAGQSAWVLEKNRMTVKEGMDFEFLDCDSTFKTDAILITDKLDVTADGNTLTLKNVSNETLENPCIYYKNRNSDGNYLGGITYMVGFDTLKSGDTAEKQAGHFVENSRIVRYSYQTK